MKSNFIKKILLNNLMKNGAKSISEKLLLRTVKLIQKRLLNKKFEDTVKLAIINNSPHVFLKNVKRRKREPLKIPFLLNNGKRISYATKLVISECLLAKSGLRFSEKMYSEFLNSAKFEGNSLKKTEELLKSAFVNKKFSNYRWFN